MTIAVLYQAALFSDTLTKSSVQPSPVANYRRKMYSNDYVALLMCGGLPHSVDIPTFLADITEAMYQEYIEPSKGIVLSDIAIEIINRVTTPDQRTTTLIMTSNKIVILTCEDGIKASRLEDDEYAAYGTGGVDFLVALEAGVSPEVAFELVTTHSDSCGGELHMVRQCDLKPFVIAEVE